MDELIRELQSLTTDIVNRLSGTTYEELAMFVSRRELVVDSIRKYRISDQDRLLYRKTIEQILSCDKFILPRMEQLREEAEHELQKLTVGRTQKGGYEDDRPVNSIFFDKRK